VTTLLMDNSAWARLAAAPRSRAAEIAALIESGRIATCLPFLLEAGYSARDAREHADLLADLAALPRFPVDHDVEQRALDAQRQLARVGHHRLPPVDLLVAAVADRHGLGVLHYDGDYDVLAEKTDLSFDSVWLAPRGSLS
jgi:predicted nucleic acid-binding protein